MSLLRVAEATLHQALCVASKAPITRLLGTISVVGLPCGWWQQHTQRFSHLLKVILGTTHSDTRQVSTKELQFPAQTAIVGQVAPAALQSNVINIRQPTEYYSKAVGLLLPTKNKTYALNSIGSTGAIERKTRMPIIDYLMAIAMALVGLIVSSAVVGIAQFLGFSGWIAGPILCVLVFAFIYLNDRLMGFGMRHVVSFLAKIEDTELSEIDKKQVEGNFSRRLDYYGFLVGAVLGMLISLSLAPSIIFDLLPF